MRSLLFVPADSERRIPKALASGADIVILDLEDSVSLESKPAARSIAAEVLQSNPAGPIYVRINALDSDLALADLEAILPHDPKGLVLPKCESAEHVSRLDSLIGLVTPGDEETPVIAIATETAASLFHMGSYIRAPRRLQALNWGMEDLASSLGALSNRDEHGQPTAPYRLARTLTLIAARAAGLEPIDAVYVNFRDAAGLERQCREAARDGFTGKMCIHPDQIGPVNETFMPSLEALARARQIVELFAAHPGGVLSLDGEMLDAPHLKAARRLLSGMRR